jgi:uncharacterized protein YbjT (DUF2867 family)
VEHGREAFRAVHVKAAARVARVAREARVEQLVHVSGIGSDPESSSPYIRARGEGEQAVQRAFADSTLIRPSVMFGPDDAFLTTLMKIVRFLPSARYSAAVRRSCNLLSTSRMSTRESRS